MWSRRTLLWTGMGTAFLLSGWGRALRAAAEGGGPYARAFVIDALSPDGPFFDPREAVAAGLTAAVVDIRAFPRNFDHAIAALTDWNEAFRRADSGFCKVLRFADLAEAKRSGRFGILLACQDAAILDSSTASVNDFNLRNLRLFYDLGLRVLQLTHNERNAVGDSFREKTDAGLSRLGENVVAEMSRLGMLIDLSHCSDRTTLEAIRLAGKPCAVTHTGCRALYPTLRNKPDEVLRALADHGGFCGIFNMSLWLTDRDTASVADVLDHLDHVVKIGGIDLPGFGSDHEVLGDPTPPEEVLQGMQGYYERNKGLPGSERPPKHVTIQELNTPRRLQVIADGLAKRGYRDEAIEKVLGGNFARVFQATCG